MNIVAYFRWQQWLGLVLLSVCGAAGAQSLYKYRGPDGEWIYTDRAPAQTVNAEVRQLPQGETEPKVDVYHRFENGGIVLYANNEFYAPVEIAIGLATLKNLQLPAPDQQFTWTIDARDRQQLLRLDVAEQGLAAGIEYSFSWLHGDPTTVHAPQQAYRAPFAVAGDYRITQAFPLGVTHVTPDSYYAVDIDMPIGTDVYAARAGTVFQIASKNFRGGLDPDRDLEAANIVSILHEDGTYAIYAHLNWNSIRVQPGDSVARGQYIADSGNTGYSSGPHLHFVVIRNRGLRHESVPVVFAGRDNTDVVVETGDRLIAY